MLPWHKWRKVYQQPSQACKGMLGRGNGDCSWSNPRYRRCSWGTEKNQERVNYRGIWMSGKKGKSDLQSSTAHNNRVLVHSSSTQPSDLTWPDLTELKLSVGLLRASDPFKLWTITDFSLWWRPEDRKTWISFTFYADGLSWCQTSLCSGT